MWKHVDFPRLVVNCLSPTSKMWGQGASLPGFCTVLKWLVDNAQGLIDGPAYSPVQHWAASVCPAALGGGRTLHSYPPEAQGPGPTADTHRTHICNIQYRTWDMDTVLIVYNACRYRHISILIQQWIIIHFCSILFYSILYKTSMHLQSISGLKPVSCAVWEM